MPPNDPGLVPTPRHAHWHILAGLLAGGIAGLVANQLATAPDGQPHPHLLWVVHNIAEPLGQIFLRLILMIVLPLIFTALVLGVAGVGDVRRLGRIGLKTLLLTVVLSSVSVGLAVFLAQALRPGQKLAPERQAALRERYAPEAAHAAAQARQAKPLRQTLLDVIPRNPLQEMVGALDGSSPGGGMLAVMFFALMFGIAVGMAPTRAGPLIGVLEGVYDAVLVIVGLAMRLAPLGVAGLIFGATALLGHDILRTLGWYVLTVLAGLALHLLGVYSLVLTALARVNPLRFVRATADALLTAFATSSSNATLPTALRATRQNLGVRPEVANFVLTIGSTANQNGTALYEGVTVLFLAQVFGVDLSIGQQVTVALLCILGGIGTAGIPGGSLPFVVLILQSVGVPAAGIGIVLGVDRILDMCRTTLNVCGDMAIATCVDRTEPRQQRRDDG